MAMWIPLHSTNSKRLTDISTQTVQKVQFYVTEALFVFFDFTPNQWVSWRNNLVLIVSGIKDNDQIFHTMP